VSHAWPRWASTLCVGSCAGLLSVPVHAEGASEGAPAPAGEIAIVGIRPHRDAVELKVSAERARAETGAHDDPAKAIDNMPGSTRSAFGSGQLLLWGAAPEDSRVYVDGVEIPQLFHGSGVRSTINGNLLQSVSLTPGAYGADYGRAIGGMVRLDTRELRDGYHASVELGVLDASALASAQLSPRVKLALGGRYGLLDRSLKLVNAPDIAEFFAVPRYHDYQAKLQIALRERESLDVVLLGSGDESERIISNSDPARLRSSNDRRGFERLYLRYRRTSSDGSSVQVVPWLGRDTNRLDARFGSNPASLAQRALRFGLRAEHRSRLASNLSLSVAGSSAELERRGSLTIPPREGDLTVFGQPPGDDSNVDTWQTTLLDVAPYATLDWDVGPLTLTPGVRIDGYLLETSRNTPKIGQTPSVGQSALDAEVEPRLSVRFRLSPRVTLLGALGVYSQPPAAQDLSAVFGSPTLGPERALHASLGESVELATRLSLAVTGFYRSMSELAVRDPSPTPKLAAALLDSGTGRSYGVQVFLQQRPWHGFSGSVAYTMSRSERRDTPDSSARLFDGDQSHVLAVQSSQALGAWTVGARLRYASGAPRTPVVGVFFDEKSDRHQPLLGVQNSQRLPSFWQIDLRLDRRFELREDTLLLAYVELLNVTNHANAEEYVYSQDYARRGTVTGMPFVAIAGLRFEL
jgi:hypothetical protein